MAITDNRLTFLDFQKQLDPSGTKLLPVAEVLNQINAPLQDGAITPSNADLGHRITLRSGLPTTTIGKVNKGILKSKATTEQRTESMALFTGRSEVDLKMKLIFGASKFNMKRASEDIAYVESLSQFVAQQFAYGSGATDEGTFDGLATRMSALQQPAPGTSGSQVWSKGTVVGANGTSIYIVDWNPDRGVHWIYPAESPSGGLVVYDHGEDVPVNDQDGNPFFAAVTEYIWSIGLAVEDPRRIGRLANVDVKDANLGGLATQGLMIDSLVDVLSYMPNPMGFNRVMYVHARILAAWRKQVFGKAAPLYITMQEYLGELIPHFENIPVRRLDQLSISEGPVS